MSARRSLVFALLSLATLAVSPRAVADDRDAVIQDLQRRVDALERLLKERDAPAARVAPGPSSSTPSPAATAEDEETARALERTLTREGGLVLPPGKFELEPRVEYTYRGTDALAIVGAGSQAQVANQVTHRNRLESSVGLRAGVAPETQFDIRVPYAFVRDRRAVSGTLRESGDDTGLGDVEVGITRQLQPEQRGRPAVLASLNWKLPTGDFRLGQASAGSGFHSVQGALTAVKRQDPLVFFGTASYTATLKHTHQAVRLDPGNALGMRAGVILAASPQTALRGAFEVSRAGMTRTNGLKVPGTDTTAASLQLGIATVISPRALFDLQLGIGVTRDAPDFRITAAVPIRFD
jgi:hypothetical protein